MAPPVVSAISAFEIGVKCEKRKLMLPLPPRPWFERVVQTYALRVEPITWEDAIASTTLPRHHNDPADRIIVSTARALNARLLTSDKNIRTYARYRHVKLA